MNFAKTRPTKYLRITSSKWKGRVPVDPFAAAAAEPRGGATAWEGGEIAPCFSHQAEGDQAPQRISTTRRIELLVNTMDSRALFISTTFLWLSGTRPLFLSFSTVAASLDFWKISP